MCTKSSAFSCHIQLKELTKKQEKMDSRSAWWRRKKKINKKRPWLMCNHRNESDISSLTQINEKLKYYSNRQWLLPNKSETKLLENPRWIIVRYSAHEWLLTRCSFWSIAWLTTLHCVVCVFALSLSLSSSVCASLWICHNRFSVC